MTSIIIHKRLYKNGSNCYLCNEANGITRGKFSDDWEEVTCKNCLRYKDLVA